MRAVSCTPLRPFAGLPVAAIASWEYRAVIQKLPDCATRAWRTKGPIPNLWPLSHPAAGAAAEDHAMHHGAGLQA